MGRVQPHLPFPFTYERLSALATCPVEGSRGQVAENRGFAARLVVGGRDTYFGDKAACGLPVDVFIVPLRRTTYGNA